MNWTHQQLFVDSIGMCGLVLLSHAAVVDGLAGRFPLDDDASIVVSYYAIKASLMQRHVEVCRCSKIERPTLVHDSYCSSRCVDRYSILLLLDHLARQ